jgi:hypothetical protein
MNFRKRVFFPIAEGQVDLKSSSLTSFFRHGQSQRAIGPVTKFASEEMNILFGSVLVNAVILHYSLQYLSQVVHPS